MGGGDAAQGIAHAGGVVATIGPFTESLFIEAKGEMSDQGQVMAVKYTVLWAGRARVCRGRAAELEAKDIRLVEYRETLRCNISTDEQEGRCGHNRARVDVDC